MHTTASLHVHPAAASTDLIFEIRRLAKQYGCAFGTTKRSTSPISKGSAQTADPFPRPSNPSDGGHAA